MARETKIRKYSFPCSKNWKFFVLSKPLLRITALCSIQYRKAVVTVTELGNSDLIGVDRVQVLFRPCSQLTGVSYASTRDHLHLVEET